MSGTFEYTGDQVLDVMSKYALNRNKGIEKLISHHFDLPGRKTPVKLLEFGAGRGEFIDRFAGQPNLITYATDLDEQYYRNLQKKHRAYHVLSDLPEPVDCIFAIDVLEHIEDDLSILKEIRAHLTEKGKVLIYVPARAELYSRFDEQIGHFRRYHPRDLREKAMAAGFTIETLKYHDFLGYFAAYYNKLLAGRNNGQLNPGAVRIYDRWLVPCSEVIEKIMRKPFIGKDLLLVARK